MRFLFVLRLFVDSFASVLMAARYFGDCLNERVGTCGLVFIILTFFFYFFYISLCFLLFPFVFLRKPKTTTSSSLFLIDIYARLHRNGLFIDVTQ